MKCSVNFVHTQTSLWKYEFCSNAMIVLAYRAAASNVWHNNQMLESPFILSVLGDVCGGGFCSHRSILQYTVVQNYMYMYVAFTYLLLNID